MKKRIKIICVCGARPNFIKIAPLSKALELIIVHTGQHYDFKMSGVFFKSLKIPKPKYNLGINCSDTAKAMIGLEKVFKKEKPDLAVVIGDVNSTLAGALAAKRLGIKVCHIESGLRSYDKTMPEEVNRVLTDHISDLLFCPTKTAIDNLKKEGITKGVYNTGDLMYDVLKKNIKSVGKAKKDYMLLTIHRASNADDIKNLNKILTAISKTGEKVIFPCHPRTRKNIKNKFKNIDIIDPVGYLEMLALEKNAKKIITDSGGVQKEAYWLKVPCITLRENTEWVETVKEKWNVLTGSDEKKIIKAIKGFNPPKKSRKLFGSGNSAKKMAQIIYAR